MDSLIKEFSARFSQFKELSETFKFIMYPDVISFDKLNLSQFDWLEIEELEMQLIDFQSSSIWIQKFIETRKKLELIEAERLTSNISKNTSNEILETWNSIPDAFNCLKKLVASRSLKTSLSIWGECSDGSTRCPWLQNFREGDRKFQNQARNEHSSLFGEEAFDQAKETNHGRISRSIQCFPDNSRGMDGSIRFYLKIGSLDSTSASYRSA
ncbi:general transcription factor II-I repeat domain-containing protein 2A [Trichonephila clavipes]|uniref:General transcription factor II-I repeat domain-containing protein 2A n=1 Tax=Trichonephila clavipes TaxID=2585209 RepID=A0A8X6S7F2_TRICX|nr:general transcription factor II-I repeat domain-containing protein 2A [Trichonephila clavipes]